MFNTNFLRKFFYRNMCMILTMFRGLNQLYRYHIFKDSTDKNTPLFNISHVVLELDSVVFRSYLEGGRNRPNKP
jgi:hypothetical protein